MRAPLAIGGLLAAIAPICIGCRREGSSDAGRTPSFLARLEFPTANAGRSKPTGLIAGDVDGDGMDEIVAATRSPGGIEIWSAISPVIGPAPEPRVFAFGDYPIGPVWFGAADSSRKDVRALAAVASRETLDLAVIDLAASLKSKPGSELSVLWRARLPARPRAIASGDLRRDGKPEVAVITIEDELLLYTGPGDPRRVKLAHEHPICALLASDGQRIVVGDQASKRIALLTGDGTEEKSAKLPGLPRALDEVDLDGDGDTELVVATGDDVLAVFGLGRAGGCATWLDARPLEVKVGSVPIALAHARLEGDREDVAVLDLHDQDLRILDFAGGSATSLATRAAGQRPVDVAIGDFDGDGALDVAVANADARRLGVFFGAGGRKRAGPCFVSESRTPCDRSPTSIAAGDFDGDGHADLAVIASADETVCVLRNVRGELVRVGPGVSAPGEGTVACADLDGSGKAVIASLQRGRLTVWTPDANGRLSGSLSGGILGSAAGASEFLLANFTGGRRIDAVFADPEQDRVGLMEIPPAGPEGAVRFGALRSFRVVDGPRTLALLHGANGALSLAVGVADGRPGASRGITLLHASSVAPGEPKLDASAHLPMTSFPIAVCAADLDGDGREDLAVLATPTRGDPQGVVVPWLAQADGSWRALDPMTTGARPFRIAAGDLDGDGKAEIFVTAQGSHHVELWLARPGDPVRFLRAPDLGAGTGPLDLLLVDLDGDGRKAIVVANGFSDDISVIRVK